MRLTYLWPPLPLSPENSFRYSRKSALLSMIAETLHNLAVTVLVRKVSTYACSCAHIHACVLVYILTVLLMRRKEREGEERSCSVSTRTRKLENFSR